MRASLGLPQRPTEKTVNPADHAREHNIDPSYELDFKTSKYTGRNLQTLKWRTTLEAIVEKIGDEARLSEQEMGLSTLFMAFGFLEWTESNDSEKKHYAPLLLLPISITRKKGGGRGRTTYSITAADDGADSNLSLQKKLERDFGFTLPHPKKDPEEDISVEDYFNRLSRAIKAFPSWKVHRWITLGHFRFGRLAMYADLDAENWPTPPVLHELVGPVVSFGRDVKHGQRQYNDR